MQEPAPAPAPVTATNAAVEPEPAFRHSLLTAIDVVPGATCLAADKLVRRVERWLEQTKVDARIRVHVRGDADDARRVTFVIDRGDGQPAERRIDDAPTDCDQLHSALALSIALAIDASLLGGGPAPELPEDDEELLADPEPAQPAYLRTAIALFGQSSSGLLTDVGLGVGARAEIGFVPWLDLRLGALYASVSDQRVGSGAGRFDVDIWSSRGDVCAAFELIDELRLLLCGSILAGRFRTVGHGFAPSEQQASLWMAGGAGLEFQVSLVDRLALAAAADLIVPFADRTIVAVDPTGTTTPSRDLTAAGALIGVGLIFRVF